MFDNIVAKYSSQFNVPVTWINAVIQTESSFNPDAYRYEASINDASYGLMQLLTRTAKNLGYTGDPDGLFDPDTNIQYGTKLLAQLISQYGNDPTRIYSAYNSGSPDKYLTSTQVATNVSRFMANLTTIAVNNPTSSVGAVGLLLAFWLWYYRKKKG